MMQALITIPVIDSLLRFPHHHDMVTHDEIREELIRQIDAKTVKQADVARALTIAPARVAEMRKRTRLVQQDEMPKLAEMLGLSTGYTGEQKIESLSLIPNWGKVAQGVWLEQTNPDEGERGVVAYDRMRGDPPPLDLFAVTPEGSSMNKAFLPGTQLICRRVQFGSGEVREGDYVIVERMAHDLRELTCKRVEKDGQGIFWLHSESTDAKHEEPWKIGKPDNGHHLDDEISIVAKVIRAVRDFERN